MASLRNNVGTLGGDVVCAVPAEAISRGAAAIVRESSVLRRQ
jgi:hypothetical protein